MGQVLSGTAAHHSSKSTSALSSRSWFVTCSLLPIHTLPLSDLSLLLPGSSQVPAQPSAWSRSAGSRGCVPRLPKGSSVNHPGGSRMAKPWQWKAPWLHALPAPARGSQEPALTHTWDCCQTCDKAKVRDVLSLASLNHQRVYARPAWFLPRLSAALPQGLGPGGASWPFTTQVTAHTQCTSAHIFPGIVAQGLKHSGNSPSTFAWLRISFNVVLVCPSQHPTVHYPSWLWIVIGGQGLSAFPDSGDPLDTTLRVTTILNLTPAAQPHQIVALLLTLAAETAAAALSWHALVVFRKGLFLQLLLFVPQLWAWE